MLKVTLITGSLFCLLLCVLAVMQIRRLLRPVGEAFTKQRQFVWDASHEPKTPLAVISANAQVLEHELRHLKQEHFYLDLPLSRMERQADGEPLNVVLHPPQGKVPCFYSESALAHWLRTVAAQQHIKF